MYFFLVSLIRLCSSFLWCLVSGLCETRSLCKCLGNHLQALHHGSLSRSSRGSGRGRGRGVGCSRGLAVMAPFLSCSRGGGGVGCSRGLAVKASFRSHLLALQLTSPGLGRKVGCPGRIARVCTHPS